MSSEFYRSVIQKGKVQGKIEGKVEVLSTTIVDILERRLGSVNEDVRKLILAETNLDTLRRWTDMAFDALDAESAQRVVQTIRNTRTT